MPNTDTLDDAIVAQFIGSTMHLYTTSPTDESDGVEVTGGTYAAQPTTLVQDPADPEIARNSDAIIFDGMPESSVVAYGIKDEGGVLLYYDTLASPRNLDSGGIVTVPANALTVTVSS